MAWLARSAWIGAVAGAWEGVRDGVGVGVVVLVADEVGVGVGVGVLDGVGVGVDTGAVVCVAATVGVTDGEAASVGVAGAEVDAVGVADGDELAPAVGAAEAAPTVPTSSPDATISSAIARTGTSDFPRVMPALCLANRAAAKHRRPEPMIRGGETHDSAWQNP